MSRLHFVPQYIRLLALFTSLVFIFEVGVFELVRMRVLVCSPQMLRWSVHFSLIPCCLLAKESCQHQETQVMGWDSSCLARLSVKVVLIFHLSTLGIIYIGRQLEVFKQRPVIWRRSAAKTA